MRRIAAAALALTFAFHTAPVNLFAQATATLSGVAHNSSGQALRQFTAQLRNVQTGVVIGKTTSGDAGAFSFSGLQAADYVVEVLDVAGQVIGTSGVTPVRTGASVAVAVQTPGGVTGGGGVNMALLLTTLAAGVGVWALVQGIGEESSPSR